MSPRLRKLALEALPSRFICYRDYLYHLYSELKSHLGEYSYIKLATDLGFAPTGIIHQIIKGRRNLTTNTGKKIADVIGLKGPERQYFMTLIEHNNSKSPQAREEAFESLLKIKAKTSSGKITDDLLEYVKEWYHPVIREMVGLPNFQSDPVWIAKSLFPAIRTDQARKSLELLERLGMIHFSKGKSSWVQKDDVVQTDHEVRGMIAYRYHLGMIDLGKHAVTASNRAERDISGITFRLAEDKIKKLKEKLYEVQQEILASEETSENTDQIYQINMQLFPVTKFKPKLEHQDD